VCICRAKRVSLANSGGTDARASRIKEDRPAARSRAIT
jgi:hypothetical protein